MFPIRKRSTQNLSTGRPKIVYKHKAKRLWTTMYLGLRRRLRYIIASLVTISLLVGLYAIYAYVSHSDLLTVKKIETKGDWVYVNKSDFEQVVKERILGTNIYSLNTDQIKKTLRDTFRGAKSMSITKKLPSTVFLDVAERRPVALVFTESSPEASAEQTSYYLIDDEGYVLGLADPIHSTLPKVKMATNVQIGGFVDKNLVPIYFQLLDSFSREKLKVSSISFAGDYSTIYVADGVELLLLNLKNPADAAKLVVDLLRQTELEGKKVKKIDLRFDQVVVSYR